ncbi:MAG: hypothetical protein ISR57_01695, partial [Bacteroidales bacterium]|nr:hypothetical protein [Bacteroidales bacterium]
MRQTLQTIFVLSLIVCVSNTLFPGKIFAQGKNDTIKTENISFHEKVEGFEERLAAGEDKLAKRTKIRLTGYIQAQWVHCENPAIFPNNTFMIRRARFKVKYQPVEGVIFVLQPNFSTTGIVIRDAYVELHD